MSTRTLLKDRRHHFKLVLQNNPADTVARKVINEITFILESLKSYTHEEQEPSTDNNNKDNSPE
jgi:hypothetical protein